MASEKFFRYPSDWKLTQESVKELISYCPESGEFRWVKPTTGRYTNLSDAIEARKRAEKRLGFHENHGRVQ